ncbi:MAG: DUF4251 domain-containing protein [Bacteroidales bacterium]|jgi:hypothetical protein
MKRLFALISVLCITFSLSLAQTKAEKEAAAKAIFDKTIALVDAKDFVIVPDSYDSSTGSVETNTDDANFISFEKEIVYLQGMIVCSNSYTNKTSITSYKQELDKKGNLRIDMQVKGAAITARVEIFVRKNGNYADVVVTPTQGTTRRFSGEITTRAESKYRKKPNVV